MLWLDSVKIARRTWEECAWKGYGLKNVCNLIGYDFKHHDALEDAKACGYIVITASNLTGITVKEWISKVEQPVNSLRVNYKPYLKLDANPDGHLFGESIVFTGNLSIDRLLAASKAAELGCSVKNNVSKKTTILVVGDQDLSRLNGKSISTKHQKALDLISTGHKIRILKEKDFKELLGGKSTF